jgi:ankyrin repeat protein
LLTRETGELAAAGRRPPEGTSRPLRITLALITSAALAVLAPASPALAADPPTTSTAPADTRLADAAMRQDNAAVRALIKTRGIDLNAPGSDGTPALHWSVRYGDADTARLLIGAGADVKRASRLDVTPLALAAANGDAAMMRLLIDAGADAKSADRTGETVLMIAARDGNPEAVGALLDHGAAIDAREPKFQQTALMIAVRENHPAIVDLLIQHQADVNAATRVGSAPAARPPGAGGGSHGLGIVRGGVPDQGARGPAPGGMTPLLFAARDGRLESAKLLLAAGAKVDQAEANAITPLMIALSNDQLPVAKLLIEHGADVGAVDWYGRTPLYDAVEVRNLEVNGRLADNGVDRPAALALIQALLDKGADPNARTKEYPPDRRFITPLGSLAWVDFTGQTPFLHAALSGDVESMRLLLKYKADPNIATFHGTTALMAAAGVNWVGNQTWDEGPAALLEAVKMCVGLGGDVNAANSMGLRAVHGAANRGSNDIITYLVSKGAKIDVPDAQGRTPLVWAGGVFLASNAPEPRPATIALIKNLTPAAPVKTAAGVGKKPGA